MAVTVRLASDEACRRWQLEVRNERRRSRTLFVFGPILNRTSGFGSEIGTPMLSVHHRRHIATRQSVPLGSDIIESTRAM